MKAKQWLKLLLVPLALILFSSLVMGENQAWLNNSMSYKLNAKWTLKFTNETRYYELTYMDPFLKNWQTGLQYGLFKNGYVAVLYKRENTKKTSYNLAENRVTLETGWKTNLGKSLNFDIRFRTEIRGFEKDLAENHLRFRLRFRFRTKMKIGKLQLKPFIGIEPFADTIKDKIFRYRFYAGSVFPLTKNVEWVLNFIRQGTKDKDTIDIINTGVSLKF
jgi:hypothetical protein